MGSNPRVSETLIIFSEGRSLSDLHFFLHVGIASNWMPFFCCIGVGTSTFDEPTMDFVYFDIKAEYKDVNRLTRILHLTMFNSFSWTKLIYLTTRVFKGTEDVLKHVHWYFFLRIIDGTKLLRHRGTYSFHSCPSLNAGKKRIRTKFNLRLKLTSLLYSNRWYPELVFLTAVFF